MQGIPSPDQLRVFLDDIRFDAGRIAELYALAEADAFRRPKRASAEMVSGGGGNDVAGLVASTEPYRVKLRHASREVLDARNRLAGAVADLNDAIKMLEPPVTVDVADERARTHPADSGDVRRAREAQERRRERAKRSFLAAEELGHA